MSATTEHLNSAVAPSQWDCIRQNLGEWHGSFTQFSPAGDWEKDTPSVLTLVEDRPNEHMQLTLARTPTGEATQTTVREFGPPGPAPYVVFFPSGAFSQGPLQRRGWSDFGAELALNVGDHRLRSVQMYDSDLSGNSTLRYLTLIREHRDPSVAQPQAVVQLLDLTGQWSGEALFQSSDMGAGCRCVSQAHLEPENSGFCSQTQIVTPAGDVLLTESHAVTQSAPHRLSNDSWQLLLLPGNALCTTPHQLPKGHAFTLELAWLLAPNHRQRLIRQYDADGNWVGLFFVTESRQV